MNLFWQRSYVHGKEHISLADIPLILQKNETLTPELALRVWTEISRVLYGAYHQVELESPEWYDGWDQAFETISMISNSHNELIPVLLNTLKYDTDYSHEHNWVRVYAISAIARMDNESTDAISVFTDIVRDRGRCLRANIGIKVRTAAISAIEKQGNNGQADALYTLSQIARDWKVGIYVQMLSFLAYLRLRHRGQPEPPFP